MKLVIKHIVIIAILTLNCNFILKAQKGSDAVIFKAMDDELNRNLSNLSIEQFNPPFFISYQLSDVQSLFVKATLGALISSVEFPARMLSERLMVGDYSLNDENFVSGSPGVSTSSSGSLPLPLKNDYDGIRRAFWIASDQMYKRAVENYSQKLTALKQQNKSDEEKLDDYSRITPVEMIEKATPVKYDKAKWETFVKDISSVFKSSPHISSSSVYLILGNARVYMISNEKTKLKIPISVAMLIINAGCLAEDGEALNDQLIYNMLDPEQLPQGDKIKQDINQMAENLLALSKAEPIKDSYSGPVIFEGEAVAELCSQKLFRGNGLIAYREPVYAIERPNMGSVNRLDDRINQKIFSENLTITETPKVKSFNNIPLIGSFNVDAEGVIPKDELILVDKGFLRNLLNDRIPSGKIKESNGHRRFAFAGASVGYMKAPGIINISYNNGQSASEIRKATLKEAQNNGLDYIYLIRKLEVTNPGQVRSMASMMAGRSLAVSKPIGVYRIMVKTGEEQLVRSAVVSEFQLSKFKDIFLGSNEQTVYNTMFSSAVPVSYITPQVLVFNDIGIEKDKNPKQKLPPVANPLLSQE